MEPLYKDTPEISLNRTLYSSPSTMFVYFSACDHGSLVGHGLRCEDKGQPFLWSELCTSFLCQALWNVIVHITILPVKHLFHCIYTKEKRKTVYTNQKKSYMHAHRPCTKMYMHIIPNICARGLFHCVHAFKCP